MKRLHTLCMTDSVHDVAPYAYVSFTLAEVRGGKTLHGLSGA
jgi:hypothetical protein